MKKILFLLILILLAILAAEISSLNNRSKAAETYIISPSAVQKTNQGENLQFTSSGSIQKNFNSESIIFKGLYDTDFGSYGAYFQNGTLDGQLQKFCCKSCQIQEADGSCKTCDTSQGYTCESRDTLPEVKAAGYNIVTIAGFYQGTTSELNHAASYGLKVLPYLDRTRYQGADLENLIPVIQSKKDNPAVFGWYLYEEPYHKYITEANNPIFANLSAAYDGFRNAYNLIKSIDPNHMVFNLESGGALETFAAEPNQTKDSVTLNQWINFGDFFASTDYGITDTTTSIEKNLYRMDLAKQNLVGKPYLATLQANQWFDSNNPSLKIYKMPTPAQMRAEMYGSLIHGSAGYLLFVQNTPWAGFASSGDEGIYAAVSSLNAKNTDVWQAAAAVNSEVENSNLKPAILSPTSTVDYSVSVNSSPTLNYFQNSPIHTMLKYYQGKLYLFSINITGQDNIATKFDFPFQITDLEEFNSATGDFGSTTSSVNGQTLNSTYSVYQVKIFRFDINQGYLEINKTQTKNIIWTNQEQTYQLHYRNIGHNTVSGVQIKDPIPSGMSYVNGSASKGGILNNGVLIWNIGLLGAHQEGSVSFRAKKL